MRTRKINRIVIATVHAIASGHYANHSEVEQIWILESATKTQDDVPIALTDFNFDFFDKLAHVSDLIEKCYPQNEGNGGDQFRVIIENLSYFFGFHLQNQLKYLLRVVDNTDHEFENTIIQIMLSFENTELKKLYYGILCAQYPNLAFDNNFANLIPDNMPYELQEKVITTILMLKNDFAINSINTKIVSLLTTYRNRCSLVNKIMIMEYEKDKIRYNEIIVLILKSENLTLIQELTGADVVSFLCSTAINQDEMKEAFDVILNVLYKMIVDSNLRPKFELNDVIDGTFEYYSGRYHAAFCKQVKEDVLAKYKAMLSLANRRSLPSERDNTHDTVISGVSTSHRKRSKEIISETNAREQSVQKPNSSHPKKKQKKDNVSDDRFVQVENGNSFTAAYNRLNLNHTDTLVKSFLNKLDENRSWAAQRLWIENNIKDKIKVDVNNVVLEKYNDLLVKILSFAIDTKLTVVVEDLINNKLIEKLNSKQQKIIIEQLLTEDKKNILPTLASNTINGENLFTWYCNNVPQSEVLFCCNKLISTGNYELIAVASSIADKGTTIPQLFSTMENLEVRLKILRALLIASRKNCSNFFEVMSVPQNLDWYYKIINTENMPAHEKRSFRIQVTSCILKTLDEELITALTRLSGYLNEFLLTADNPENVVKQFELCLLTKAGRTYLLKQEQLFVKIRQNNSEIKHLNIMDYYCDNVAKCQDFFNIFNAILHLDLGADVVLKLCTRLLIKRESNIQQRSSDKGQRSRDVATKIDKYFVFQQLCAMQGKVKSVQARNCLAAILKQNYDVVPEFNDNNSTLSNGTLRPVTSLFQSSLLEKSNSQIQMRYSSAHEASPTINTKLAEDIHCKKTNEKNNNKINSDEDNNNDMNNNNYDEIEWDVVSIDNVDSVQEGFVALENISSLLNPLENTTHLDSLESQIPLQPNESEELLTLLVDHDTNTELKSEHINLETGLNQESINSEVKMSSETEWVLPPNWLQFFSDASITTLDVPLLSLELEPTDNAYVNEIDAEMDAFLSRYQ